MPHLLLCIALIASSVPAANVTLSNVTIEGKHIGVLNSAGTNVRLENVCCDGPVRTQGTVVEGAPCTTGAK